MADDIVTRLRNEAETFWDVRRFRPLWIEAADEIERLRDELKTAIKGRENWRGVAIQLGAVDWSDRKKAAKFYEQSE